jgi:hypothetical protein
MALQRESAEVCIAVDKVAAAIMQFIPPGEWRASDESVRKCVDSLYGVDGERVDALNFSQFCAVCQHLEASRDC